jgi:urease accessory protein
MTVHPYRKKSHANVLWPALAMLPLAVAASEPCFAHGFVGKGWLHPLTGFDHMLAMLAVGAWSAQLGGAALYAVPSAFVCAMALGGFAAFSGWVFAGTELAIAFSVLGLGLAIAVETRLAWPLAAVTTMLFGAAHGYAHGIEIPHTTSKASYVAGFMATTAGLHLVGAVAGLLVLEQPHGRTLLCLAGTATSAAGIALVFGFV